MLVVTPSPRPPVTRPGAGIRFSSAVARAVGCLIAAAGRGFLDGLFDRLTGFAGALLNAAIEFFVFAFSELKIVIRELGPLLLQLAFGDVPVALDFEFCHNVSLCSFV
jgi:hypothetical protein